MIHTIYKKLIPEKLRINFRRNVGKLIYPIYFGNKYHCNCCGKRSRKFLAKGNIRRLNAQCPFCQSLERTRLLDFYLQEELKLYTQKGINLLHIAPEDCLYRKISKLDINYIDGDINPAYARHKIDITQIEFKDDFFDIIICSHVLGHIPDEAKAIRELRRVLKPTGVAIIMTVIKRTSPTTFENKHIKTPQKRLTFFGEPDLCRLHGLDFKDRLARQGFKVEEIDYRNRLPQEVTAFNNLGNGDRELIFLSTK